MKRFGVNLGLVGLTLTIFLLAPVFVQAQMMKKGGEGIVVNCPLPHQCVASPISVQGKAKSAWFSDGAFNMTLVDDKGNQISTGTVKAQGDWQKAKGMIPFAGKMDFSVDKTTKAKLVLEGAGQPESGMKTQPQTTGQPEGGTQKGMPPTGQPEGGMGKGTTAGGGMKKEIPVVLSGGKTAGKTPEKTPMKTPGMTPGTTPETQPTPGTK